MKVTVIVASNRAAQGVYADASGPILRSGFQEAGFDVDGPYVVADGEPVAQALRAAIAEDVDVVVTSGGTGLTSMDRTPETTKALVDREVPGVAEAIRSYGLGAYGGASGTPMAMLSRGIAGVAKRTFIVNLAGSTGAARDGLAVLLPVLPHIVDQIHDGDH